MKPNKIIIKNVDSLEFKDNKKNFEQYNIRHEGFFYDYLTFCLI